MAETLPADATVQARVEEVFHSSPVMFIENVGQFDEGARFQVRGGMGTTWLAEDAIWITLLEPVPVDENTLDVQDRFGPDDALNETLPRNGVNLRLSFPGSNSNPQIEPSKRLDTVVSYFIGSDPEQWHPDVPVWGGVRYVDLYPGIDLEVTSENGRMVQRMIAEPGADLNAVRLKVEGADGLALDGDYLRLITLVGQFALPLMQAWVADGGPVTEATVSPAWEFGEIAAPFVLGKTLQDVPGHAADDPVDLLYSTFLGGGGSDSGYGIAVDGSGNAYVTGDTYSSDFPTAPGAFDRSLAGERDAFVAKLNSSGSALSYATFLGGNDGDSGGQIAIDASGAAYVTGHTYSPDFPATPGAFDRSMNGGADTFVAKLNPSGTALSYATFLGGNDGEAGLDIAVDPGGAAYVTGLTDSTNFPTTLGAFDRSLAGEEDTFVAKLNSSGSALSYATFLGGNDLDWGAGIGVDASGAAYVTGHTFSFDFPTTPGAFDRSMNGGADTFVAKLNPSGSALSYATFLGGNGGEAGHGIAVDPGGAAYVTGVTFSVDFPTTPGAFDRSLAGAGEEWDTFVAKLNPSGSALSYATFLGGNDADWGFSIAIDASGAAYVVGYTSSPDFPTTPGAFDRSLAGEEDTFLAKLNPSGSTLSYATFLGGDRPDWSFDFAVDASGAAYVVGYTCSPDFPTTPGAFDRNLSGSVDVFVGKLAMGGPALDLYVESLSPVQVLEEQNLVKDKATAVKVVIRKTGTGVASNVSVRLNDGSAAYTSFFVSESSNTDANHALILDNASHPLNFGSGDTVKTVYFFSDDLSPSASTFQVSATVDYLAAIVETDETNNTALSQSFPVSDTHWSDWDNPPTWSPNLYLHYFRTDWGETPASDFYASYVANNAFVSGVYPVSGERFRPSVSTQYLGDTTLFRGSDGRLSSRELGLWALKTIVQMRLAHPTKDRFIAVVPPGWFAAKTELVARGISWPSMRELIIVEAPPTRPNASNAVAHEIGHSYGLDPGCEEYEECNPSRKDGIGNYASPGLWVEKRIPIQVTADRKIYCFMGANGNYEYWIDAEDCSKLMNDHVSGAADVATTGAAGQAILAVGKLGNTGAVTLDNWYFLPEAELSTLPPGPYTFDYQNAQGQVIYHQHFSLSLVLEGGAALTESPFVFTIPYVPDTARIVVKKNAATLAQKPVSSSSPIVTVLAPNGGEKLSRQTTIRWSGYDADGDTLSYAMMASFNGGETWETIAVNLTGTSLVWDISRVPPSSQYLVKVIATDGIRTGQDQSDAQFAIWGLNMVRLPMVITRHP